MPPKIANYNNSKPTRKTAKTQRAKGNFFLDKNSAKRESRQERLRREEIAGLNEVISQINTNADHVKESEQKLTAYIAWFWPFKDKEYNYHLLCCECFFILLIYVLIWLSITKDFDVSQASTISHLGNFHIAIISLPIILNFLFLSFRASVLCGQKDDEIVKNPKYRNAPTKI